jgi:dienelactone hydrolase
MADVLLFHHALGLTAGVQGFAEQLRAAGHTVMVPDLYDGARFDTITEGVAHAEEIGFETLIDRGVAVAEGLGDRLVVAGFSLGVLPAQKLAQTRPGVIGAVLYHAAVPTAKSALSNRPRSTQRAQVPRHAAPGDFVSISAGSERRSAGQTSLALLSRSVASS